MTSPGLSLLILSAVCTGAANQLLRGGILRPGGLAFSMSRMKGQVLVLCRQLLFISGIGLYAVALILRFPVLRTEDQSLSYPLMLSLTFVLVALGAAFFSKSTFFWRERWVSPSSLVAFF